MDAHQPTLENPFDMDEACQNCSALCETRNRVVHGYGEVDADFLFVGEMTGEGADRTGVPFTGDEGGRAMQEILRALGFSDSPVDAAEPDLENVFLTNLTRCRHPERPPEDGEIGNCEPFLNAEIRMINPEIIVPVGQRALTELALEYTTTSPEEFDVEADHATTVRGRGFELVPMLEPASQTETQREAFLDHFAEILGRDYRQTKGRRGR